MNRFKSEDAVINIHIPVKRGVVNQPITYPLEFFNKNPKSIKCKSIMFYGASGSGKSTIIKDFMFSMKHLFPRVVIFSPTAELTADYKGMVPDCLIYETITLENLSSILSIQQEASEVYKISNNVEILKKLFRRIESPPKRERITKIETIRQSALNQTKLLENPSEKKKIEDEIMESYQKALIENYKSMISENIEFLKKSELTEEEERVLKFINYIPDILVIFDDAATEIKALVRKGKKDNNNVIADFFFKGRHFNITHFYSFQDDSNLDTEIKKNAFISIFTTEQVANAFFGRASNNFNKDLVWKAQLCASKVFKEDDEKIKSHRKLVYIRLDNSLKYYTANMCGHFKMCSESVWKYCEIAESDSDKKPKTQYARFFE